MHEKHKMLQEQGEQGKLGELRDKNVNSEQEIQLGCGEQVPL